MPKKFPVLHSERLTFDRIRNSDLQLIFEGLSHPEVIKYYGVNFKTLEETKTQINWYRSNWRNGTGVPWAIWFEGQFIGVICIYLIKTEHKKAEIGYWIFPEFWGKGLAKESLSTICTYVFDVMGLHRLEAFVESENDASGGLLLSCGFQKEGTMRDAEWKNGKFIDLDFYARLV